MTKMMKSFGSAKLSSGLMMLLFCLFSFLSIHMHAATIIVAPPPASIQAAINAANSGDTIQLSAGTYIEPIQIISKNLTIIGAGQNNTIIQAPNSLTRLAQNFVYSGVNYWCIVVVDNLAAPTSQTVNISDLTVDGVDQQDTIIPPIYGNSERFFAIGYHNANGTVQRVHTTSTRQYANFNELAGGGIVNASNVGTVTFTVDHCLVDFYQRLGIDFRGASLTGVISNSTINRGYVLTPNTITATPNGIQFSGSATGSITDNIIESNIGTVFGAQSAGILPFGAGANVTISGNTVNNNDLGIAAISNGNNLIIDSNIVNFTTTPGVNNLIEGIYIQDTNGLTTVSSNVMNNLPFINMDIYSSTDQVFQLSNNEFNGSQTGLLVTGGTTVGPMITMNSDVFTGTTGYYIQEAASPNDIWPSTASVSFDGLVSGHITFAEFNFILTKIFDQHNDPALGLVLDFIPPTPPTLTSISPNSGPQPGGNTITITGTSFLSSNTQVFFGAVPGTNVVVVNDTTITVTVPAGVNVVDVTVTTPFGTTPVVPAGQYTYVVLAPLPPTDFIGHINKNRFLNKRDFILNATWDASPSENVVAYRIYRKGRVVDEIFVDEPFVFTTCLKSKKAGRKYSIVAVNTLGLESVPLQIWIVHD